MATDSSTDQLLAAIQTAASEPGLSWARPPQTLTGGFWAEMWRVRLAGATHPLDGELVARIMPDADVAARETIVQRHLASVGYPTPVVHLAAGPGPDLDRAWMLMDLAPGKPLLADLSGPGALLRLPSIARRMPKRLAEHAAALHDIDPEPLRAIGTDPEAQFAQLEAQTVGNAFLEAIVEWLRESRPQADRNTVCHGDLHPFNVLADATGDTVLDWSSAQLADPAFDIAYTRLLIGHPPLAAPRALKPLINAAGKALARRFTSAYNKAAAHPVDPTKLEWFSTLHALGILVEIETWRRQGEFDQHLDHPFLMLEAPITRHLTKSTGFAKPTRR